MVFSVHYRQAPEHKFPAAVEDAEFAYRWAVEHAADLGADPSRVAIAGESAGGNLATVVSRLVRDTGGTMPAHQLLVYPVTNYDFDTPSYREEADAVPLNRDLMKWFFQQYLRDASDGADPAVSPLRTADLSNLPPATVIVDEFDPLRSEGEAYAERLRQAGVPVRFRRFDGVTHEFFGMGAVVDKAQQAEMFAAEGLKDSFDGRIAGRTRPARIMPMVGMEVFTADGQRMGQVKQMRDADFLVDQPGARDCYVPMDAIASAEGRVTLRLSKRDVDARNWPSSALT